MIASKQSTAPRAFLYARVSRIDQLDDATLAKLGYAARRGGGRMSYPQQKREAFAWYQAQLQPKGVEWGGVVEDPGQSAFKLRLRDRPGGKTLCDSLRPGDCVITTSFDRLFRNHLDCMNQYSEWRMNNISWYALDLPIAFGIGDTLVSDLVVMIYSGFAEMESRRKRERRLASIRATEEINGKTGNYKPWGYRYTGNRSRPSMCHLTPDWLEVAIMHELHRCRQLGATCIELADCMSRAVSKWEGTKYQRNVRYNERSWGYRHCKNAVDAYLDESVQKLAVQLDDETRRKLFWIDYPRIMRERFPLVTYAESQARRLFLRGEGIVARIEKSNNTKQGEKP